MKPPSVAIVGRTNVGKSTLFNSLAESNKALVSSIPGTTRDRHESDCFWQGHIARVVDTGGLNTEKGDPFGEEIKTQAETATKNADLVLFVVDAQTGVVPDDRELARWLKQRKKPILLVANKADNASMRNLAGSDAWKALGFGAPVPISAKQGVGVGDLLDRTWEMLRDVKHPPLEISEFTPTRVMVFGTPNVGKSSLLNAILNEPRFITSPIAHTTREPNDTLVEVDGRQYLFIDTAGLRKMGGVKKRGGFEILGVKKTLQRLPKTDVILFVIDATAPIGMQEKHLAGLILEEKKGMIVVANKWDLVKDKEPGTPQEYLRFIAAHLPFLSWAPVVFTSALTKQRITTLLELIAQVQDERYKMVPEEDLETFLKVMVQRHRPSRGKGVKHPTILRLRQVGVAPPHFVMTVKGVRADVIHPSYLRFVENQLREQFGFDGTPLHITAHAERRQV